MKSCARKDSLNGSECGTRTRCAGEPRKRDGQPPVDLGALVFALYDKMFLCQTST